MPKPLNILEGESVEEFDALNASLHAQYRPDSETERFLVNMMVNHEWMMRRAIRMQQRLFTGSADETARDRKQLELVVRYHKTHERGYAQAKRQLEAIRKPKRPAVALPDPAESIRQQRQWEQILKKMPTLTNWVN